MPVLDAAVAAARSAVGSLLHEENCRVVGKEAADALRRHRGGAAAGAASDDGRAVLSDAPLALVACSGGPDSLALAAAAAFAGPRHGWRIGAVIVDHGLQEGSGQAASNAGEQCRGLGLDPVMVESVDVGTAGGPEAAARAARYAALERAADETGAQLILLGHTADDQAETVLLALARGSGIRTIAGMPPRRGRIARPFLTLRRHQTEQACQAQGLTPWLDPTNDDPAESRRAALRLSAMPALAAVIGPGLVPSLARTAELARTDADALDELAQRAAADCGGPGGVDVAKLAAMPMALRTRVLRAAIVAAGVSPSSVTSRHLNSAQDLVTDYHGQRGVVLPGGRAVVRAGGMLVVRPSEQASD